MKKLTVGILLSCFVALATGCADGPVRRWLRGSQCDPCKPMDAMYGSYYAGDFADEFAPYYHNGSNLGGSSLSTPMLEPFGIAPYGGIIGPSGTAEPLPGPRQ